MYLKSDLFVFLVFGTVQARITWLWLRYVRVRWPGGSATGARVLAAAGNLALLGGFLLSISKFVSWLHLSPRPAMYAGAAALGYLIVATVALALYTLVEWFKKLVTGPETDPGRRRFLDLAGLAVVASPAAVMGYGTFVQRTDFRVREVDVPLPGLSAGLDGLRVLQLSDIHLGAFLSERELARVIDAANGLHPHLAAITGDLISSHGDPLDACLRQLARLRCDAGVWGCMGNHERYSQAENQATAAGARLGIAFLRHQHRVLRFGSAALNLAGVDYQSIFDRPYLIGAEELLVPEAANILLSHNPDVLPVAAAQGYHLMLAGHTHGGQVTVEILDRSINPARFLTPYVYGLYREAAGLGYVTRGIGTIGIPARIGAPPEIALLRLRKV